MVYGMLICRRWGGVGVFAMTPADFWLNSTEVGMHFGGDKKGINIFIVVAQRDPYMMSTLL